MAQPLKDRPIAPPVGLRINYVGSRSAPMDAGAIRHALCQVFRAPGYKPPALPHVALEVLQLTDRPVPELVERDAGEELWSAIHDFHEEAGGLVARLWRLPAEIEVVMRHHHRVRMGGVTHPLIAAIVVAEQLVEELGQGLDATVSEELDFALPVERALAHEALGLPNRIMADVRAEAARAAELLASRPVPR